VSLECGSAKRWEVEICWEVWLALLAPGLILSAIAQNPHTRRHADPLFPAGADPIKVADKLVILESRFAPFHLSVKFPLKDMMYKGELAL